MDIDTRSRIWILTETYTHDHLRDHDIPKIPCDLIHAKLSKVNQSISVFLKFSTLKAAAWVSNQFGSDQQVIKKSKWEDYKSFCDIPFDEEVVRDGRAECSHHSGDRSKSTGQLCYTDQDGSRGTSSDDELEECMERVQTLRKRVRDMERLREEYRSCKRRVVELLNKIE